MWLIDLIHKFRSWGLHLPPADTQSCSERQRTGRLTSQRIEIGVLVPADAVNHEVAFPTLWQWRGRDENFNRISSPAPITTIASSHSRTSSVQSPSRVSPPRNGGQRGEWEACW